MNKINAIAAEVDKLVDFLDSKTKEISEKLEALNNSFSALEDAANKLDALDDKAKEITAKLKDMSDSDDSSSDDSGES